MQFSLHNSFNLQQVPQPSAFNCAFLALLCSWLTFQTALPRGLNSLQFIGNCTKFCLILLQPLKLQGLREKPLPTGIIKNLEAE